MKALRESPEHLAAAPEVKAALRLIPREEASSTMPAAAPKPAKSLAVQIAEIQKEIKMLDRLRQLRRLRHKLKSQLSADDLARPSFQKAKEIATEVLLNTPYDMEDLMGPARPAALCEVRFEYYRRARAAGLTLELIGRFVNRGHDTVAHGLLEHGKGN
jgi:hypothetical protein